jgi:hypothetical protein
MMLTLIDSVGSVLLCIFLLAGVVGICTLFGVFVDATVDAIVDTLTRRRK